MPKSRSMTEYQLQVWSRGQWWSLPYLYTNYDEAIRVANATIREAIEGEGLAAGCRAVRVRSAHISPITVWQQTVPDGMEPDV